MGVLTRDIRGIEVGEVALASIEQSSVSISDITLQVNGQSYCLEVGHHWTLLEVLRERLDLTGAKNSCDRGECGSCTVLVAGKPFYSCLLLAVAVGGRPVVTVEGLMSDADLDPVQQGFLDNDGAQCGFCTPGFLFAARALLDVNPEPTDDEIREALSGNLCRCNAYGRMIQSVREAARLKAISPRNVAKMTSASPAFDGLTFHA